MAWKDSYQQWLDFSDLEKGLKEELLAKKGQEDVLEDAFYRQLEFGTGGMRGLMGPGTNRMNIYTVRQASEGLAHFIEKEGNHERDKKVAIAYDPRHQSAEFALEVAKTLASHGIKSYLFESLRPTPELSFAVRHLKTDAGIMITASHNPPEYNGLKVYGADGGQLSPREADELIAYVQEVDNILTVPVLMKEELEKEGLLEIIGETIDQAYLDELKNITIDQDLIKRNQDLSIVFSPLHGTGQMIGRRALENAGFESIHLVEAQAIADPDFSTVQSPNPEDPAAFELAMALGKEVDADLLIATDPDADRLGVASRLENGDYQVLTGNQLAALMLDYLLKAYQKQDRLPKNGTIIKSIVSSELPSKIAESYQVGRVDVLTGFKFIAEKIKEYEQTGEKEFLFGFEESYGYLIQPFVRDKDAIQALLLVAELAAYYKEAGKTLLEGLDDIFEEYGYYQEKTIAMTMPGIEGAKKIEELMRSLREEELTQFAGVDVIIQEDYATDRLRTKEGKQAPIGLGQSNVLKYYLADGSWIAVRPSGTEPKIKFYIGAQADSQKAVSEKVKDYTASLNQWIKD